MHYLIEPKIIIYNVFEVYSNIEWWPSAERTQERSCVSLRIPLGSATFAKGKEGKVWEMEGFLKICDLFCNKSIRNWDNYWRSRKMLLSLRCPFKRRHTPEGLAYYYMQQNNLFITEKPSELMAQNQSALLDADVLLNDNFPHLDALGRGSLASD